ncbi:hypothetical protein FACHB389_15720 [Nostoc calcicola FACHB-389]|nr:hypothetical protein FACHB389_15720 [Nostoc calcicola FACHB-389]
MKIIIKLNKKYFQETEKIEHHNSIKLEIQNNEGDEGVGSVGSVGSVGRWGEKENLYFPLLPLLPQLPQPQCPNSQSSFPPIKLENLIIKSTIAGKHP